MKHDNFIKILKQIVHADDRCWEWPTGRKGRRAKKAYRHSCSFFHGQSLENKRQVNHICGNGNCVNPNHIYWGNQSENMNDLKQTGYYKSEKFINSRSRGNKNGMSLHPEKSAFHKNFKRAGGENNGRNTKPESWSSVDFGAKNRGQDNKRCTTLLSDVIKVKKLQKDGVSNSKMISEIVGISRQKVKHILSGHTWKHITI